MADLASRAACAELVERVLAGHGRLDLLVNNAATMTLAEPTPATMDLWWRDFQVNLSAPLWLAQAALPALREARGQVINMCSVAALHGEPGFSAYAASKAGLLGLTRSLARELAPAVRVNAVAPGPTDTLAARPRRRVPGADHAGAARVSTLGRCRSAGSWHPARWRQRGLPRRLVPRLPENAFRSTVAC